MIGPEGVNVAIVGPTVDVVDVVVVGVVVVDFVVVVGLVVGAT